MHPVNHDLRNEALNTLAEKAVQNKKSASPENDLLDTMLPNLEDLSPEELAAFLAILNQQAHVQKPTLPRWYQIAGMFALNVTIAVAASALAGATVNGASHAAKAGARGIARGIRGLFSRQAARPNLPAYTINLDNFGGNNPAPHWDYSGCF